MISSKKTPHVVFIHGANATPNSFNYIISQTKIKKYTNLDYKSSNGFYPNLASMIVQLQDKGPLFLISHSLGGIYATHLTKHCTVVGGVSISTPFGGSKTADFARLFMPANQLFKDIGTRSKPIVEAQETPISVPWVQVVTTAGDSAMHITKNDGVVTHKSMTHRTDVEHEIFHYTHYEIMTSPEVVKVIENTLKKVDINIKKS